MAKTENIFGELGGGNTFSPKYVWNGKSKSNSAITYAGIDATKNYVVLSRYNYADTNYDRISYYPIVNGAVGTAVQPSQYGSDNGTVSVSGTTLSCAGTNSSNYTWFDLIQLDE